MYGNYKFRSIGFRYIPSVGTHATGLLHCGVAPADLATITPSDMASLNGGSVSPVWAAAHCRPSLTTWYDHWRPMQSDEPDLAIPAYFCASASGETTLCGSIAIEYDCVVANPLPLTPTIGTACPVVTSSVPVPVDTDTMGLSGSSFPAGWERVATGFIKLLEDFEGTFTTTTAGSDVTGDDELQAYSKGQELLLRRQDTGQLRITNGAGNVLKETAAILRGLAIPLSSFLSAT